MLLQMYLFSAVLCVLFLL